MWGGTPHRKSVYREGGTPHIFSEQGTNRGWGHRTYFLNRANKGGGDTAHQNSVPVQITSSVDGWVGGPVVLVPLRGSILQAETCQILNLAENPRWSPSVAKTYMGRWGHRTYFLDGGTIGVGKKHILGGGDTAQALSIE